MADVTGDARIRAPAQVRAGEVFEVKTLLTHPMELSRRPDSDAAATPRQLIRRFVCTAAGEELFSADLDTGVAANPYLAFYCRLRSSAELRFTWEDENGATYGAGHRVEVTG